MVVVHKSINYCLQIADFGMSRDLMDETYYVSHGEQIPVKWTAPEVQINWRGLSHGIITFRNRRWKTAAILEFKEIIVSMATSANACKEMLLYSIC